MNPLTNMKNVLKLSEHELKDGAGAKSSWHDMYRDSAWIFVGGFPYNLTEGDIICIFSQYGEIVNINLVRDKATGKSKGFCFLCYEDQRSTVLAVDNLNGIKILDRTLRVDHVANYKPPKENEKMDEETLRLYIEGCAPKPQMENVKQESRDSDMEHRKMKTVKQENRDSDRGHKQVLKHKRTKSKSHKKEKKSKKSKKKKRVIAHSSSESGHSVSDSDLDTRRRKRKHK